MGPSRTRARTRVPCIGRRILNHCATREVPGDHILRITIIGPHSDRVPRVLCLQMQEDTRQIQGKSVLLYQGKNCWSVSPSQSPTQFLLGLPKVQGALLIDKYFSPTSLNQPRKKKKKKRKKNKIERTI